MLNKHEFDLQLAMECANSFSNMVNIGCVVSDRDGNVLYETGYGCNSCSMCEKIGLDKESCKKSQIYGMLEAERFGGKYVYFCPLKLNCFVSPIFGKYGSIAKITVGPFLMVEPSDYIEFDLLPKNNLSKNQIEDVGKELKNIPVISASTINYLSTLLFMAVSFINNVSEANRMLDTQSSNNIQGQITQYISELKGEVKKPYPFNLERDLMRAIGQRDKSESKHILNQLFGYIFLMTSNDFEQAKSRIYELLVLISRTAINVGADADSTLKISHTYRQDLSKLKNMDDLCFWLTNVTEKYIDSLFTYIDIKHGDAIHKVVQYIRTNYSEKITLDDMATMVYLSPSYFSRIFKHELGTSFSAYLTMVRIEKSKEMLLHSNLKLIDISIACGFSDQSYFTKIFKKNVGMLPLKYQYSKGGLK